MCLSLLGTWPGGGKAEKWAAATSSMLQLLVSIQSLIFVDQPFFNEPGYEASMATPDGKRRSDAYNRRIHMATVRYGMIDLIRHPPAEFAHVIRLHFKHKGAQVIDTAARWAEEAKAAMGDNSTDPVIVNDEMVKTLKELLAQ